MKREKKNFNPLGHCLLSFTSDSLQKHILHFNKTLIKIETCFKGYLSKNDY